VDGPELRVQLWGAGGRWLSRQAVHNAGAAFKKAHLDKRKQRASSGWESQREDALRWLESQGTTEGKGWEAANITVSEAIPNWRPLY